MSKKAASTIAAQAPKPEMDYETHSHMRTILDAHEILGDPVKLKKVHKLAGRHKKALTSLQQLKDIHQEKYGQPSPGNAALKKVEAEDKE